MSILRKCANGTAAFVVAVSSVLSLVAPSVVHAAAQTCAWTGTAGDGKFSTATNWTDCNSDVPQAGDILLFNIESTPTGTDSRQTLDNDINVAFGGITSSTTSTTSLKGYELANNVNLAANAVWNIASNLSVFLATGKTITVAGDFTVQSGDIWSAVTANTMTLKSGAYLFGYEAFKTSTLASLVVENGAGVACYGNGTDTTMSYPIILGGGAGTQKPVLDISGCGPTVTGSTTLSNVTLLGDAEVGVYAPGVFKITNLTANSHTITRTQYSTGTLVTALGTEENQPKTTALDGDQSSQDVSVVNKETATLSGKRANVSVLSGGILKGTGSADSIWVNKSAIVAPGNSPGCLTSDRLQLSGDYQFEIGGTEACAGYDQLKVLNASNTADAVMIDVSSATLTTSLYNKFTPKKDQVFVIINQGGDKAVNGTFKDLPEGATFEQNGIVFKISYVGGDGNDVTLTVQNTPTTPDTGFVFMTSHPLFSGLALAILGLGVIGIARRTQYDGKK